MNWTGASEHRPVCKISKKREINNIYGHSQMQPKSSIPSSMPRCNMNTITYVTKNICCEITRSNNTRLPVVSQSTPPVTFLIRRNNKLDIVASRNTKYARSKMLITIEICDMLCHGTHCFLDTTNYDTSPIGCTIRHNNNHA